MQADYQEFGYLVKRDFFETDELDLIEPILRRFHEKWLKKHRTHYDREAINSAYITHKDDVPETDRLSLFAFITSDKIQKIARAMIPDGPAFMNTQLFFNPANSEQANYWHRDIQYVPYDVERQKTMMKQDTVLHFRVPLADEPGIELVPGTHVRWDNDREFETRMGENGRVPSDDLPDGKSVPLKRGDLMVFSANMIHRGLYGGNRFAFDIIFSDADPELLRYVDPESLPEIPLLSKLSNPSVFEATRRALGL